MKDTRFSQRLTLLLEMMDQARLPFEGEYTVEYVSDLLGLDNPGILRDYLSGDKEPDKAFKTKIADSFGVNSNWVLYGQGDAPFAGVSRLASFNAMDILRRDDLSSVRSFHVFVFTEDGHLYTGIVKQMDQLKYTLYPTKYLLHADVGASGASYLVSLYRFFRESSRIDLLDQNAYIANERDYHDLFAGKIPPKSIMSYTKDVNLIDDLLDRSVSRLSRGFIGDSADRIIEIINTQLKQTDLINQEYDLRMIRKQLGERLLEDEPSAMLEDNRVLSDQISKLRNEGKIINAIKKADLAIKQYPENNFFYKIKGDLLFENGDYLKALEEYMLFLEKLGGNTKYFKNFVNIWKRCKNFVSDEELKRIQERIEYDANKGKYHEEIVKSLVYFFHEDGKKNDEYIMLLGENGSHIWRVLNRIEKKDGVYELFKFLVWISNNIKENGVLTTLSDSKRIQLASAMEKHGLYAEAVKICEYILSGKKYDGAIHTLFRNCRKSGDYSHADAYVLNDGNILNYGFDVQYELFYYYHNKGDKKRMEMVLDQIRQSASSSIPISKTLQNFYVILGRMDEAARINDHITWLSKEKSTKVNPPKGTEEEKETQEQVLIKIRNMQNDEKRNNQFMAVGQLLKGFSHELGQPITNIRFAVQLHQMKRDRNENDDVEKILNGILRQTERVSRLMDRFAPIISGKSEKTLFECTVRINGVLEDMRTRLEGEEIDVEIKNGGKFELFGDPVQFDQIFYNLFLNSIDELININMPRKIWIESRIENHKLRIVFRDNGRGIPQENLPYLFTPFFTTKEKCEGNGGEGLGLYIVNNIVTMYGGEMESGNSDEGGAQFVITLPEGRRDV